MHQLHAAESQENHKKTAYRKPHPTDVRKRSTSFPLGPNSRFETDDDGTIPLMGKKTSGSCTIRQLLISLHHESADIDIRRLL